MRRGISAAHREDQEPTPLDPGLRRDDDPGGYRRPPPFATSKWLTSTLSPEEEGDQGCAGEVVVAELVAARSGASDSNLRWYSSVTCLASSLLVTTRGVISTISSVRLRL